MATERLKMNVILIEDEDGYTAFVKGFPGVGCGTTADEAKKSLIDSFKAMIEVEQSKASTTAPSEHDHIKYSQDQVELQIA